MFSYKSRIILWSAAVTIGILGISMMMGAQVSNKGPIVRYTAVTDNVAQPGQTVRIELFAWSTPGDRDEFVKAWTNPPVQKATAVAQAQPPAAAAPAPAAGARGARGAR